jgi:hypothetical protein
MRAIAGMARSYKGRTGVGLLAANRRAHNPERVIRQIARGG